MCKFFCIPTQPCFCSPRIDRLILKTKAYSCSFLPGFISIWLMPPYFPLFAIPIQNVLPRWLMVCVTMPDGSPEIFCYSSFPTFLILNFLFLLRKCFAGCRVFRIIVLPLVQWCYAKCALTFTISGDISIEEHRKLNAKLFFFLPAAWRNDIYESDFGWHIFYLLPRDLTYSQHLTSQIRLCCWSYEFSYKLMHIEYLRSEAGDVHINFLVRLKALRYPGERLSRKLHVTLFALCNHSSLSN